MDTTPESNCNRASLAGALFLFLCIPLAYWGQMYVPSTIFVAQDPAATAANLLSREFIFRSAIVVNLMGTVIFSFMTLLLYRVFRPVDKHLALLMIIPIIAQIAVAFILESFNYSALLVLKSEARQGFGLIQQQETAYLLMRLYRGGMSCDKLFFGLSFIPWGVLVWRSGLMPRVFGVLLIISGIGYVIDTCTGILLDRSIVTVVRPFLRYTFFGFLLTMLWLLVKGVPEKRIILN